MNREVVELKQASPSKIVQGFKIEEEDLNEIEDISPHKQFVQLENKYEKLTTEYTQLQELFNDQAAECTQQSHRIEKLQMELKGLTHERKRLNNKIYDLERINESLKREIDL